MKFIKKHKKLLIGLGLLVLIIVVVLIVKNSINSSNDSDSMVEAKVTRGNLEVLIDSEGTIEPKDRYEITSLVTGEILASNFEEGDVVKKDDILYTIDSTVASSNLAMAENSFLNSKISADTARDNVNNLTIKANSSGYVTGFNLHEKDNVVAGSVIATITNYDSLKFNVAFGESQIKNLYVGQDVVVTLPDYMTTTSGKISYISDKSNIQSGSLVYDVEVTLTNPGIVENGARAGVSVNTVNGIEKAITTGSIEVKTSTVVAKTSGEVKYINVKNNQKVNENDILVVLKNDDYAKAKTQSDLAVSSQEQTVRTAQDTVNKYTLKSPIDGVVITKNKKAGDNIDTTYGTTTPLMVVANVNQMKFNMDIDELDITKIKLGQSVRVKVDAIGDKEFVGRISNIPAEGETVNGVTTYSVEVMIDEPGELKTGMNADADIVVESVNDVLIVPMSAVTEVKGVSYAYVKDKGQKGDEYLRDTSYAPLGYVLKKVTLGASNNDYIEVKSGLNENDIVYSKITYSSDFMSKMSEMHSSMISEMGM